MSRKEHERAVVLARVVDEGLALGDAAALMEVSYRQAKRLAGRYRKGGRAALVHGGVGRPSNRARPAREHARVLELVREEFGGRQAAGPGQRFGPTLACEHLEAEYGLSIPRTTLAGWMVQEGLWSRARRGRRRQQRRERRKHFGELVQLDGSFHDWYEGRGERGGARSCVMNMVDDATGRTLLRFGDQETIWAAANLLRQWIVLYGVPRALYTDWKNIYKRVPTAREERLGLEAETAFGRMCKKLGIRIIAAGTPQAKGRVERSNGVHQDRLIKKMRRLGISDDAAANGYVLKDYLPAHNARFGQVPAEAADYHVPLDPTVDLDDVICIEHRRVVSNDYVVQFEKQGLQLDRKARGRVPAGSWVLVRQSEEGRLRVIRRREDGREHECKWTPAAPRAVAEPKPRAPNCPAARARPSPEHPWRKANKYAVAEAQARKVAARTGPTS